MGQITNVKTAVKEIAKIVAPPILPKEETPVLKTDQYFAGAIVQGKEHSLGQCIRKDYLNEFIDFWKDDYRAKIKCVVFLAIAFLSWNIFAPFSLFMVALASRYWDHAMWCRNISRFNGNFRTIIYGN